MRMATPGIAVAYNEFQITPPNPLVIPQRLGQENIPGVVPLIREGAPVRSLAFTGRGLTFSIGSQTVATGIVNWSRYKIGPVPFWGLVRTFAMGAQNNDGNLYARLCYSDTDENPTFAVGSLGGDTPCYKTLFGSGNRRALLSNSAVGAWWSVNLNFLLPGPNVWLAFHLYHTNALGVLCNANAEVLEVIPEI